MVQTNKTQEIVNPIFSTFNETMCKK